MSIRDQTQDHLSVALSFAREHQGLRLLELPPELLELLTAKDAPR